MPRDPKKFEEIVAAVKEIPPCKYCGRLVLLGGPCCPKAAHAMMGNLAKERDHARKCLGRADKRVHKLQKETQTRFEEGVLWGMAILLMAEAIRNTYKPDAKEIRRRQIEQLEAWHAGQGVHYNDIDWDIWPLHRGIVMRQP